MSDQPVIPESAPPNVYGPVTPGLLFERTFALLRENFKLFFGIVSVLIGVEIVISLVLGGSGIWLMHSAGDASPIAQALVLLPLILLGAALIYVFTQIVQGALFIATQAKLAGHRMSVGEACRLAAEKGAKLVGIALLVAIRSLGYMLLFDIVLSIPLVAIFVIPGIASHPSLQIGQMPSLGFLAFFALCLLAFLILYVVVLLWLFARYALSIPAALAENLSVTDAIRRSVRLSAKSRGRLYALFLLILGLWIAIVAVTLPFQLLAMHAANIRQAIAPESFGVVTICVSAIRIVFSAVIFAIMGVAATLCYYDLRVRKEGFGSAGMAAPIENLPATFPPTPGLPPDIETGSLPIS